MPTNGRRDSGRLAEVACVAPPSVCTGHMDLRVSFNGGANAREGRIHSMQWHRCSGLHIGQAVEVTVQFAVFVGLDVISHSLRFEYQPPITVLGVAPLYTIAVERRSGCRFSSFMTVRYSSEYSGIAGRSGPVAGGTLVSLLLAHKPKLPREGSSEDKGCSDAVSGADYFSRRSEVRPTLVVVVIDEPYI